MPESNTPSRRELLGWAAGSVAGVALARPAQARAVEADVCVFGGTAAGVVAAVTVHRLGGKAVLVGPDRHLGGLTSGGLGQTDIGNKAAIGGTSREFYQRVLDLYTQRYGAGSPQVAACNGGFRFEPSVAAHLMDGFIAEARVPVYREHRLKAVRKRGNRIVEIEMDNGAVFRAGMFIDASYEGDLLAMAGVSFHVGREANAKYGETLNGIQFGHRGHAFQVPVDPYRIEGDPRSGLLKGITPDAPGNQGDGDHRVQAYNFRMCLTNDPANMLPFPKPPGYDPERYELAARYLNKGFLEIFGNHQPMPNRKSDTNNHGGFGTDNIGMNYRYPTGDRVTRSLIYQDHVDYQQGLMWFLVNDPRVPGRFREAVGKWGLARDEFPETGGWPHQLYVREARRMVSDYVMTEHNCRGKVKAEDPVGLAAYNMDSHHVRRIALDGKAVNEGDVQVGVAPYPIAYRSLVPRAAECANLLVPVCLASSHISYGSIRMEPVFMILAQSAATAALQALRDDVPVQRVDYSRLREQLLKDRQVLEWTGPSTPSSPTRAAAIEPRSFRGVALDDQDGMRVGDWQPSARASERKMGTGYIHDGNANKGGVSITYTPDLPAEGDYEIILYSPPNANRATNVPVTIRVNGSPVGVLTVNQRLEGAGMYSLGRYRLPQGRATTVLVANDGTDGHVVADGIQFLPVAPP
jgi:hypothetical protein